MEPEGKATLIKTCFCHCCRLHKTANEFFAVFNLFDFITKVNLNAEWEAGQAARA